MDWPLSLDRSCNLWSHDDAQESAKNNQSAQTNAQRLVAVETLCGTVFTLTFLCEGSHQNRVAFGPAQNSAPANGWPWSLGVSSFPWLTKVLHGLRMFKWTAINTRFRQVFCWSRRWHVTVSNQIETQTPSETVCLMANSSSISMAWACMEGPQFPTTWSSIPN